MSDWVSDEPEKVIYRSVEEGEKAESCRLIPDSLQRRLIEIIPNQADFFQMYL